MLELDSGAAGAGLGTGLVCRPLTDVVFWVAGGVVCRPRAGRVFCNAGGVVWRPGVGVWRCEPGLVGRPVGWVDNGTGVVALPGVGEAPGVRDGRVGEATVDEAAAGRVGAADERAPRDAAGTAPTVIPGDEIAATGRTLRWAIGPAATPTRSDKPRGCAGSSDGRWTGPIRPGSGTPPMRLTTRAAHATAPRAARLR